jgi:hypothetical protein
VEHMAGRAQGLNPQRRDIRDYEPARRRLGHPSWDRESGLGTVSARCTCRSPNHLELRTCQRINGYSTVMIDDWVL